MDKAYESQIKNQPFTVKAPQITGGKKVPMEKVSHNYYGPKTSWEGGSVQNITYYQP